MSADDNTEDSAAAAGPDSLDARNDAAWELHRKCMYRSAVRVSTEVRRAATASRRLLPLLQANFHLMNAAQNTLDPRGGREAAVENISFLESGDRARAFDAALDEAGYEHACHWMTACSYDNLAVATGVGHGYNADGMRACVADGIAVCRRTGKTECVTCFREYATEVHRAADDLDMALHFARQNARQPAGRQQDRRHVGAKDEADLLLLGGRIGAAWEAGQRAWALADTFHNPVSARLSAGSLLHEIALASGRGDWVAAAPDLSADRPPEGEYPAHDLRADQRAALAAAAGGDPAAAAAALARWDKWLTDHGVLHQWFETRLRLVAAYLLVKQPARADALAKPLREKATAAKDYLTLRRLAGMLDGSIPPTPLPLAARPTDGPAADAAGRPLPVVPAAASEPAGPAAASSASPSSPAQRERPDTPLRATIDALAQRLQDAVRTAFTAAAAGGAEAAGGGVPAPDVAGVRADLLAIDRADRHEDAAGLIHLAAAAARFDASAAADPAVWAWAEGHRARHPDDGPVLNAVAALADVLRQKAEDSPLADELTVEAVGTMYKRSLDLNPDQPNGFARAGEFFLDADDPAEAERCFARAFRLDRSNAKVARQLNRLYASSDRMTDGLAALDLCLREGGESPELLWDAGLAASALGRHEPAVAYLARLEERSPGGRWVNYYRAQSLLALNRPAEALAAIDAEAAALDAAAGGAADGDADPDEPVPTRLHVHCLRAAAAAALGRPADVRAHAAAAFAVRLAGVGDLSRSGIAANLGKLREAVRTLPVAPSAGEADDATDDKEGDDALRRRVDRLLLASGLMPDDFFRAAREAEPAAPDLTHYVVTVRQPLGQGWMADPARLPDQDDWDGMLVRYGVLAVDADEAARRALAVAGGLFPVPPALDSVESQGDGYRDHPGITWQSYPERAEEDGEGEGESVGDGSAGGGA